jgi:hypothetical protein
MQLMVAFTAVQGALQAMAAQQQQQQWTHLQGLQPLHLLLVAVTLAVMWLA